MRVVDCLYMYVCVVCSLCMCDWLQYTSFVCMSCVTAANVWCWQLSSWPTYVYKQCKLTSCWSTNYCHSIRSIHSFVPVRVWFTTNWPVVDTIVVVDTAVVVVATVVVGFTTNLSSINQKICHQSTRKFANHLICHGPPVELNSAVATILPIKPPIATNISTSN